MKIRQIENKEEHLLVLKVLQFKKDILIYEEKKKIILTNNKEIICK